MKHQSSSFSTTRRMVTIAMLAAAYCAISVCLLPFSFGAVQVRVAEALTMLALFGPTGIWGVTLGCLLTNAIGAATGANILGVLDIFFGTGATLIAAWMSYGLHHVRTMGLPIASSIPPVLVNAVVIGGELCAMAGNWNTGFFLLQAGQIAVGQILSCCVLGVFLIVTLEKSGAAARLFGQTSGGVEKLRDL